MMTVRFSALLSMFCRTPPPVDGGVVSMVAVNVTATVASTKIRMFTMMSRNGTMLSSPPSSSGASSRGWLSRRIFATCAVERRSWAMGTEGPGARRGARTRSRLAPLLKRQQIERLFHRGLEVVLDGLGARVEHDVRDHAE